MGVGRGRGRGQGPDGRKAPEYPHLQKAGDGSLLVPWLSLLDPLFGDPLRPEWGQQMRPWAGGSPPPGWLTLALRHRKELDFGNMLVNGKQTRMLVLLNDGDCTLHYRLFLEQEATPKAIGNSPLVLQAWAGLGSRGRSEAWVNTG